MAPGDPSFQDGRAEGSDQSKWLGTLTSPHTSGPATGSQLTQSWPPTAGISTSTSQCTQSDPSSVATESSFKIAGPFPCPAALTRSWLQGSCFAFRPGEAPCCLSQSHILLGRSSAWAFRRRLGGHPDSPAVFSPVKRGGGTWGGGPACTMGFLCRC